MASLVTGLLFAAAAQASVPLVLPPHSLPAGTIRAATVLRGPLERARAQSYISPLDYPAEARGVAGKVRFTLTISPDGRVIACNVVGSSGSTVLDAVTCKLIQWRARYVPAVDSNGDAVVGTIEQEVEWKAPLEHSRF